MVMLAKFPKFGIGFVLLNGMAWKIGSVVCCNRIKLGSLVESSPDWGWTQSWCINESVRGVIEGLNGRLNGL